MINNVINNNLIKELRRRTGVGVFKCKQALIEANGNVELAMYNMRKSGLKTDLSKSGRRTTSGLISVEIASNHRTGVMIEVNCETDFVAKNNVFKEFTKIATTTALSESINNIAILESKMKEHITVLINKVGENIKIRRLVILRGNYLSSYVHFTKIGVIISTSGKLNTNVIKQIAMHIAAKNPRYIDVNNIEPNVMIQERQIQIDIALKSGKNQKVIEKVIEGRIDKFIREIVLTKQDFIIDNNKTVGSILNDYGIKVDNFVRFEIGDYD